MNKNRRNLGILVAVLTLGVAALAFAHGGYGGGYMMGPGYSGHMMGYGGGYMMGPGYGGHRMGYGAYGGSPGVWNNLPEKDAAALNASQEKFFNETKGLRNQIEEKQVALDNELAAANPDQGKLVRLQKDLSGLQAKFDQKAVAHQLEVRKLLPENFSGNDYAQGYGYGGNCWR